MSRSGFASRNKSKASEFIDTTGAGEISDGVEAAFINMEIVRHIVTSLYRWLTKPEYRTG
jgi:hypothetical protein